jgi:parallel beta-helix repeat protein
MVLFWKTQWLHIEADKKEGGVSYQGRPRKSALELKLVVFMAIDNNKGVVMKSPTNKAKIISLMFIFGLLLCLLPSPGEAATRTVNCNVRSLQSAINRLDPGDTLRVTNGSTCNENVVIDESHERIIINGLGTATINGPDTTLPTVRIRGRNITLTGLTITGGEDAVAINRGGTATVAACTIQGALRNGILVGNSSSASVTNSMIQNNGNNGVSANRNSYVRLGFVTFEGAETIPGGVGPNTIQNNGHNGVRVAASADADIIDNTISGNTESGVLVVQVSHALIASNTINSNGEDGVTVGENSGVNLGRDSGTDLDEMPNDTTVNNTGFGIRCFLNSSANGRRVNGTATPLDGVAGGESFPGSCVESLD